MEYCGIIINGTSEKIRLILSLFELLATFCLVKEVSMQNGHYSFTFLLHFSKKGRLPLYQVVESFRPAIARAYRLAQANIAYSRFSFFFNPRYTVFIAELTLNNSKCVLHLTAHRGLAVLNISFPINFSPGAFPDPGLYLHFLWSWGH